MVLSCCHGAIRQIRIEGVIGIAQAFLGSGARSMLAARCALGDAATEQFSESESLHEARKWMTNNGFDKISHWTPFIMTGDSVTFDFGNWLVPTESQEA